MRILITGGNTWVHVDSVRVFTNVFRGTTAVAIAKEAYIRGHEVTLVGNPQMKEMLGAELKNYFMENLHRHPETFYGSVTYSTYRTYDELYKLMEKVKDCEPLDAIVHSAAVSDYKVDCVMKGTPASGNAEVVQSSVGKIPSSHSELWIRMVPTEKIIDNIREKWGFGGTLVKFKLEVGKSDEELIEIAKKSRLASKADIMVANCKRWARSRAYMITGDAPYQCQMVMRDNLADRLMDALEGKH